MGERGCGWGPGKMKGGEEENTGMWGTEGEGKGGRG